MLKAATLLVLATTLSFALAAPPACLLACIAEVHRNSECSSMGDNCMCTSQSGAVEQCLTSKCSSEDASTAQSLYKSSCGLSVSPSSSLSSSSSSSSSSSPSSVSSVSTSVSSVSSSVSSVSSPVSSSVPVSASSASSSSASSSSSAASSYASTTSSSGRSGALSSIQAAGANAVGPVGAAVAAGLMALL